MGAIIFYGIMITIVVYFTIGLFGGYDTDKDNPWKKKQSGWYKVGWIPMEGCGNGQRPVERFDSSPDFKYSVTNT